MRNVYDAEAHKARMCAKQCSTCIFNPESPFRKGETSLRPGRFKEMAQSESYVTCHKTLGTDHEAVCRGFADARSTNALRVMERLSKGFKEIDPDA